MKIARTKKTLAFVLALVLVLAGALAGCGSGGEDPALNGAPTALDGEGADPEGDIGTEPEQESGQALNENEEVQNDMTKPVIEITMENGGIITVELDPEAAPITTANFLKLVDEEFYDGLTFHRIIPDFMIQGGDPLGTGTGGTDEKIKGEFAQNGWDNPISHKRGVISMARSNDFNSASCQFFITNADKEYLDGGYAAFGKVTSGMEVVDEISAVPTDVNDRPDTPVVIKTIRRK